MALYILWWKAKDFFKSLRTVVKGAAYDLVIEAVGTFKWYLGLKAIFYKTANSGISSEPPLFFCTDPFPFYHKYNDKVWEIVKEQLEKQINNYECNGSGWIVSRLVSLDVSFSETDDPLKPKCVKDTNDDDDEEWQRWWRRIVNKDAKSKWVSFDLNSI